MLRKLVFGATGAAILLGVLSYDGNLLVLEPLTKSEPD